MDIDGQRDNIHGSYRCSWSNTNEKGLVGGAQALSCNGRGMLQNYIYGPRSKTTHPVRSRDGALLASSPDIKDGWVEQFSELLNQPTDVDASLIDNIEQLQIDDSLDLAITEEELEIALKSTKLGKSPGPKGVLPEVLVHAGNTLKAFFCFSIISMFWVTENIPSEVADPNIAVLFKKGDRSQCGNYRGISVVSVVGKVFADILL
ncbi:uncharacterized protein [Acropora muricata]|uniref:uncharacterized protein n=1 Tax=Acropora muricata TaxID=159855 RepID=UPI0034E4B51A